MNDDTTSDDALDGEFDTDDACDDLDYRVCCALTRGDLAEVTSELTEGADVLARLAPTRQAEWLIAAIGAPTHSSALLVRLLEAGLDPSAVYDELGPDYAQSPAMAAAAAGRLDLLEMLAEAGANLHWSSPTGANAASYILPSRASQAPRPDTPERAAVAAWLEERGVKVDPLCLDSQRKLNWAAYGPNSWPDIPPLAELGFDVSILGWPPFMQRIVSDAASVDEVAALPASELAHRDSWDRTPLILSAAAGRADLVSALLSRGSSLNEQAWCGATALHVAARHDHMTVIDALLDAGMDIESPNEFGEPALREAVAHGHLGSITRLLDRGASMGPRPDPRHLGENLDHLIHEAASADTLRLLIERGAPVNDVSGCGKWPLRSACAWGDANLVGHLLALGADPNLTSTGETALFDAVRQESLACIDALLDAGARINAQDCDGWTCLWHVESPDVARHLLARGADPALPDEIGSLPESWNLPREVTDLYREHRGRAK